MYSRRPGSDQFLRVRRSPLGVTDGEDEDFDPDHFKEGNVRAGWLERTPSPSSGRARPAPEIFASSERRRLIRSA